MAEHRLMNNSKKEKASNAMNLLTIQPGGLAPTIGSPSTKGTRSSRYTQLAVEIERLKFEIVHLHKTEIAYWLYRRSDMLLYFQVLA